MQTPRFIALSTRFELTTLEIFVAPITIYAILILFDLFGCLSKAISTLRQGMPNNVCAVATSLRHGRIELVPDATFILLPADYLL